MIRGVGCLLCRVVFFWGGGEETYVFRIPKVPTYGGGDRSIRHLFDGPESESESEPERKRAGLGLVLVF